MRCFLSLWLAVASFGCALELGPTTTGGDGDDSTVDSGGPTDNPEPTDSGDPPPQGGDEIGTPAITLHGGGPFPPSGLDTFVAQLPDDASVVMLTMAPPNDWVEDLVRIHAALVAPRQLVVVRTTAAGSNDRATAEFLEAVAAATANLPNVRVVANPDAGAPELVQVASKADYFLVPGGFESRLAHVRGTALGKAVLARVQSGVGFHGMSAGAMGALEYLSNTAFLDPLNSGLGLLAGATVLAHAERDLNPNVGLPQVCSSFRALASGASTAIAIHSDSYVTVRDGQVAVPAPFTIMRNGQTQTIDHAVYVFRNAQALPAEFRVLATAQAGSDVTQAEITAWQACASELATAAANRQRTALEGAVQIYYPGETQPF